MSYGLRQTALYIPAAAGGQTIAVGQATETDLAQAIAWAPKRRLVGQAAETDLAQTLTRVKTQAVAQAIETDAAQAIVRRKTQTIGQTAETDLAQTIARLKTKTVGQAAEADLAQAITRIKTKILGQAFETDLAQDVTTPAGLTIGQAIETDLAQAITRLKAKALGQVSESDVAQSLTARKLTLIAQAVESDSAQPLTRLKTLSVSQVLETDLAQIIIALGGLQPALIVLRNFTLHIPKLVAPSQKYVDLIKATSGLIAYWRLGETSGTTAVDEMGLYNGTYIGNPTLGSPGALIGDFNAAVIFDDNKMITAPAITISGLNMSIEAWFKWTTTPDPFYTGIGGGGASWELRIRSSNAISCVFYQAIAPPSDIYTEAAKLTPSNDGLWHHVIAVLRNGLSELFVDGVLVGQDLTIPITSLRPSTAVEIGHLAAYLIGGSIDEVAIYNVALTAGDALIHYDTGRGGRDRMLRVPSFDAVRLRVPSFDAVRMI